MQYTYTDREGNNFNLIRMIAAYLVILSHATAIQGRGTDIVVRITGQTHSGQMAVFIFTFLSGIFITKSIMNYDAWIFFKKRFLRIYPELFLCLMFILILGAIFTTLNWADYWTNPQTRRYFIANLLEINNEHILPGVFENHPMQGMNGVLWYITFEIRIYLVWILMKTLGIFEDKYKANIVLGILLIWVISRPETLPLLGGEASLYGMNDFPQYTITFILGAMLFINVERLHIRLGHVLLVVFIMAVLRHSSIGIWVWAVGYIVIAIFIGTHPKLLPVKVRDLSYGIFLYGWPTGQLVNEFMPNASALIAATITAIIATGFALVSERVISGIKMLFSKIKRV